MSEETDSEDENLPSPTGPQPLTQSVRPWAQRAPGPSLAAVGSPRPRRLRAGSTRSGGGCVTGPSVSGPHRLCSSGSGSTSPSMPWSITPTEVEMPPSLSSKTGGLASLCIPLVSIRSGGDALLVKKCICTNRVCGSES